jgi:RimJ/RimL family protein N-acetyltransferase
MQCGNSACRYTAYRERLAVRSFLKTQEETLKMTVHPPEIDTDRLLLRQLSLKDAPAMYSYRSDPKIMCYQTWHPSNEKEVAAFIRKNGRTAFNTVDTWFQLGVYLQATQELIGDLGIHFLPVENRQVEIGFTIGPAHQHKGYATEAVSHLLDYVLGRLGKHRVIASVDPANAGSIRLLERIGMRKEAHFRKSIWNGKDWADDIIYALLEKEWTANK